MRRKQWSLFVKWSEGEGAIDGKGGPREGIVQFRWIEGEGGQQIDYWADHTRQAHYDVHFEGTETFDGFVKWAFDAAVGLPGYEFFQEVGCPDCGTILNAKTAQCQGRYHSDNRADLEQLADELLRMVRFLKEQLETPLAPNSEIDKWPMVALDEGVWCGDDDCPLQAENSQIGAFEAGQPFTLLELRHAVAEHIVRRRAREDE